MIASTIEPMVELVNKELLIFRRFQVDPKGDQIAFAMVVEA
jgi:hypothetical protein